MTRLNWNFSIQRRVNRIWIGICGLGLLASIQTIWWRDHLLLHRDRTVEKLKELAQPVRSMEHSALPTPAALEAVFLELRSPWTEMVESLQHASRPGVDLLSLEPDSNLPRRVHIRGIASSAQEVFDLVESLQDDPSWTSVQLVSQTSSGNQRMPGAVGSQIPTLPGITSMATSFSLVAEWNRP